MLIVVVLFATVLLRAGIVMVVVYLVLPKSFSCPRCADRLTMIHHPILQRLLPQVQHRWCLNCGWSGIVRRARERRIAQSRVIKRAARS
jgi:ribosomal protein S27AE